MGADTFVDVADSVSKTEPTAIVNGSLNKIEQPTELQTAPKSQILETGAGTMGSADGSGWSNPSPLEDGSGWLSADGTPVVLPPAAPVAEKPWPASQRRIYYAVRIPRTVDEKVRNDIKLAESRLEEAIRKRDGIRATMQARKATKGDLLEKLKPIREKERACREAIQGKRTELEPYLMTLNKFKSAQNTTRNSKGLEICSSEDELNDKMAELQYRIQHESISLKEEKQLLRDIKLLESTRGQVRANSELQAELIESLGPKEEIQDQYKFICQDLDAIRKEHKQTRTDYEVIDKEIEKINKALEELRQQFEKANIAQQEAFVVVRELRKQESAKNDAFFQNKRDVQAARELISQKKLEDLDEFCSKQVEDFFTLWNSDSKFRSEYVKSNERSTIRRFETLDGRLLGPNEKPLQLNDESPSGLLKSANNKVVANSQSNLPASPAPKASKVEASPPEITERAVASESLGGKSSVLDFKGYEEPLFPSTSGNLKSTQSDGIEDDASYAVERKEKRRQEEMAKAREAAERKKKRADKAESKALARAKKDEERKEKEREKKARKKAATGEDAVPVMEEPVVETEKELESSPTDAPKNSINEVHKPQKAFPIHRRRPSSSKSKGLRPALAKSLSKEGMWPLPIWALALIAFVTLLVLLGVVTILMRH